MNLTKKHKYFEEEEDEDKMLNVEPFRPKIIRCTNKICRNSVTIIFDMAYR